ncbi:hypothetical protein E4P42_22785 [Mycobacterium sp. PS03-16]|uniref:hypothetical protein n=1 Tax=Mycobacterium sp. PS03-16 TaxID=2559611 RepID=UPI0010742243|nr:hypothetical protein [Mycobacterium sp. PS03-16]TFV55452.1 hypothetical protein E4P42_22785 [Mycobacterium sp. PS03-16]
MRPSTALSIASVIFVVKAIAIGWVTWGRAHLTGATVPASSAGLTIATVVLVIGLACGAAGLVLRRRG